MTHVLFDLDGTLANTRPLVKRAYESVGVKMPSDAWGKPWQEWLPALLDADLEAAERTHALKNISYNTLLSLHGVESLPAAALAKALSESASYQVGILTGASFDAAVRVRRQLKLENIKIVGSSCTVEEKISHLEELGKGVYVDDDMLAGTLVANATRWAVLLVQPDATVDNLVKSFKEALWTL